MLINADLKKKAVLASLSQELDAGGGVGVVKLTRVDQEYSKGLINVRWFQMFSIFP